tara:strand:- start:671 stop:778 length:108 start_codon:yes stop_codon:yes gene_type:complete
MACAMDRNIVPFYVFDSNVMCLFKNKIKNKIIFSR